MVRKLRQRDPGDGGPPDPHDHAPVGPADVPEVPAGDGELVPDPRARLRPQAVRMTDPICGPWHAGHLAYDPEPPWPKGHPLLPSQRPPKRWTGSIYDVDGGQVVRHEASGWRPTREQWELLANAPALAEKVRRYEEVLLHVRAALKSKRPDVLALRLYLERELPP